MTHRMLLNFISSIALALSITACTDSSGSPAGGASSQPTKEDLARSEKALEKTGAKFTTTEKDENINIILSFDELNERVKNSDSAQQKIKYFEATLSAMNEYVVKAEALLKTGTLGINDHNSIVKKRNMVMKRSKDVQNLIAAQQEAVADEKDIADQRATYPFNVKIGSVEFPLCEQDYENLSTALRNRAVLSIKNDLKIAKILLCLDSSVYSQASVVTKGHVTIKKDYFTQLYVQIKPGEEVQFELPKSREAFRNRTLTNTYSYTDDERPTSSPLVVSISALEMLSIAENSQLTSLDFITFVGSRFLSEEDQELMSYLEDHYSDKDTILGYYESPAIRNMLSKKFEKAILKTTEEIIGYVVEKDYENLAKFSKASNINRVSYSRDLKIKDNLTTYGLSPLMVAALLYDQKALEILLAVEGVNPNLESPVFKRTYRQITGIGFGTLAHIQNYGLSSSGGARSGNGSGSGAGHGNGSGGRGNITTPKNVPAKYQGYTALMIAVAEGQCDIVESLIELEPFTLNYRSSRGRTALSVALSRGYCIEQLVKSGAFDINIFYSVDHWWRYGESVEETIKNIDSINSYADFLMNVDDDVFKDDETIEKVTEILLFSGHDQELKNLFKEKVPRSLNKIKPIIMSDRRALHIEQGRTRGGVWGGGYDTIHISTSLDFNFLKSIGFNLLTEKVFGEVDNRETLFDYVLTRVNSSGRYLPSASRIQAALSGFFAKIIEGNPELLLNWANSDKSFKGQSPLVAASMFNEEGIVKALLSIEGIDVSVVDTKTGYNAFEWQYVVNPFMWHFTYSNIASALAEKGAVVQSDNKNLIGKPKATVEADMKKKWKSAIYPFKRKSVSTKVFESEE